MSKMSLGNGYECRHSEPWLPPEERVRPGESALARCAMTCSGGGRFSGEPASGGVVRSAGRGDAGRCRAWGRGSFLGPGLVSAGSWVGCSVAGAPPRSRAFSARSWAFSATFLAFDSFSNLIVLTCCAAWVGAFGPWPPVFLLLASFPFFGAAASGLGCAFV